MIALSMRDFLPTVLAPKEARRVSFEKDDDQPVEFMPGRSNSDRVLAVMAAKPNDRFCSADFALIGIGVRRASTYLGRLAARGKITLVDEAHSGAGGGPKTKWYRIVT